MLTHAKHPEIDKAFVKIIIKQVVNWTIINKVILQHIMVVMHTIMVINIIIVNIKVIINLLQIIIAYY